MVLLYNVKKNGCLTLSDTHLCLAHCLGMIKLMFERELLSSLNLKFH